MLQPNTLSPPPRNTRLYSGTKIIINIFLYQIGIQLVQYGADMAILRSDGKTALELAEEEEKVKEDITKASSLHLNSRYGTICLYL